MNMQRTWIAIIVAVVLLGGIWYLTTRPAGTPSDGSATTTEQGGTGSNTSTGTKGGTAAGALNVPNDATERNYQAAALAALPDADKATFEAMIPNFSSGGTILFRDKDKVYLYSTVTNKGEVVTMVDRKTFVYMQDVYYKDTNSAYFLDWTKTTNAVTKIQGASADAFKALNYWYTRDDQKVFYLDVRPAGVITAMTVQGAVGKSFAVSKRVEGGIDVGRFGTDATHVFSWGQMVVGADYKTFAAIDATYFKDANSVFAYSATQDDGRRLTRPLSGVKPNTFTALGGGYGKTATAAYYLDKEIEGADVATFKLSTGYGGNFAADKNHTYKDGVVQP